MLLFRRARAAANNPDCSILVGSAFFILLVRGDDIAPIPGGVPILKLERAEYSPKYELIELPKWGKNT